MSLKEIQTELQTLAAQNALTFAAFGEKVPALGPVAETLPPVFGTFKNVNVALSGSEPNQVLTMTGTIDWGLLTAVPTTITVTADSSSAGRYLTNIEFHPDSVKLSVPGLDWFELNHFSLNGKGIPYKLYQTGLVEPAIISVGATLVIKKSTSQTPIPILITIDPTGVLQLTLNTSAIDLPSINDILAAFGDTSGFILPPTLNELLNFSLTKLYVAFQPSNKTVTAIGVEIGNSARASKSWPIIPDVLSLVSYKIGLDVADPLKTRRIGGLVSAKALLGTVDIEITASHPAAGGWDFQGYIGEERAVPIGDLILGLGKQFHVTLPAALHEFTLKDFEFGFNTDSGLATGKFTVDFTIQETPIELTVSAEFHKENNVYKKSVTGKLLIGASEFDVTFKDDTSKLFTAKWNTKNPLGFADIANHFGWKDMPPPPESLDLSLTSAEFLYDFTAKSLVLSAHSKNYGQIVFATFIPKGSQQRVYVFELDVPLNVNLTDLPLIGPQIPSDIKLGIKNLEVIIASGQVDPVSDLNTLIATIGDSPLIPKTLNTGLTFAANLQIGSGQQPFILPLTSDSKPASLQPTNSLPAGGGQGQPTGGPPASKAPPPNYQAGAQWFTIGKTLGPVSFQRIGVQYQDSKLFFLLDASLDFSALKLAADGLGLGSPLTEFKPEMHLNGVSLSFSSGPVTIDGGFLVVPPPLPKGVTEEYMGEVVISIKPYLISGVAAYAKVDGHPSVFVFAEVQGEFGGPPAFFITGFMGGFGYNSELRLPDPDQLYTFPFIAGLDNPTIFGSAKPTPVDVMTALSGSGGKTAWVTPTTGENWIAAGVMFRSFELVLGRVLLLVEFGKEFEIALLGIASLSLPQGSTTDAYAYVELQLQAVFKPSEGSFSIIASLTQNSFLLSKECHLTGGFAFCLWFGPSEHAGDFVITIGGYHPAFVPHKWYPKVPQVGFNWNVGGGVTVKGGAYFALTPTAVMAGGNLEVLYQSGDLRAWFTAYANMMIRWKPFYFTAGIGISLGASFRLNLLFTTVTITIEIGASLELWGPPTGGVVTVHLWIFSFTVKFGAEPLKASDMTLDWSGFKSLLPSTPAKNSNKKLRTTLAKQSEETLPTTSVLLNVNINRGLLRQDSDGTWIVRADELVFTTQSAIPANSLKISNKVLSLPQGAPSTINIRPMALQGVNSSHVVTLTYLDENKEIDLGTWPTPATQTANLPEALWGKPLNDKDKPAPSAATIPGLPTGLELKPPPASAGPSVGPVDPSSLIDPLGGGYNPLHPEKQSDAIPPPVVDANSIAEIMTTLASPTTVQAQQQLVTALNGFSAAPPTSAPLTQLAKQAGSLFSDAPLRAA